ncbi:MAG: histidine kinase dimerization/phospho-acceptor domain-containing protein [Limnothrix sp.]
MEFELDQLQVWRTVSSVLQDVSGFYESAEPMSTQQAQGQWRGAIAALENILENQLAYSSRTPAGLILSSPSPICGDRQIIERYQNAVFTPKSIQDVALCHFQLVGAAGNSKKHADQKVFEFPLMPNDPLQKEQFCLILTPEFSFAMVLDEELGFQFSFDPEVLNNLWQMLQWRMALTQPFQFQTLQKFWQQFKPVAPDYRLVAHFSRLILRSLPEATITPAHNAHSNKPAADIPSVNIQPELELLQALTHEIRTPLTTIRTMTKLLLKKKKQLTTDIVKRIETIEQECNEQIRRMELIFRAAEMETPSQQRSVQLIPTSLEQLFHEGTPRWQKQAKRRNVALEVVLPKKLPQVVSDPAMLDQVLSGLIETFTRRLPSGSEVQLQVTTAGDQLKLEVQSNGIAQECLEKAIGQLLTFQPETGSLSLNPTVTKNLFHALGGKLRIRHRPSGEDVFTIFLPLGSNVAIPVNA